MRSVDVVFPASMCAMIPILRVSSSLNALPIVGCPAFFSPLVATASVTNPPFLNYKFLLPAVVRERLVRFRHAVHVFLLFNRPAARIGCVNQLIRQLIAHGLARALARILQQPTNRQRLPPERIHFHRNLVVRAAHAPRLHFERRLHVLHGLLEKFQRVIVRLLRHLVHGAVKHPLRRALFSIPHHRADKLLNQVVAVNRIFFLLAAADESFTWHCFSLLNSFPFPLFFTSLLLYFRFLLLRSPSLRSLCSILLAP